MSEEWATALDDPLRSTALAEVNTALRYMLDLTLGEPAALPGPSLSEGLAGQALFLHYAHVDTADDELGEALARVTSALVAQLASHRLTWSFHDGVPGIAWTLSHTARVTAEDPILHFVDTCVMRLLERPNWIGYHDLVGGLVGLGVYALERMDRTGRTDILEKVVKRLADNAVYHPAGATWLVPGDRPSRRVQGNYYDLGLAHGIPGVLGLLGLAADRGITSAVPLLASGLDWITSQVLKNRSPADDMIPQFLLTRSQNPRAPISAWCYGNAGVAAGLMIASSGATSPAPTRDAAIRLARTAATLTVGRAGIREFGLCHGASGLGHILARFYNWTGDQLFRTAAEFWLGRALVDRSEVIHNSDEMGPHLGLMTGLSGYGLALLAATSSRMPTWDRILMLS